MPPPAAGGAAAAAATRDAASARQGYGKMPPLHEMRPSSCGSAAERQHTAIAHRDVLRARAVAAAPSTTGDAPLAAVSVAAAAMRARAALQRRADGVHGEHARAPKPPPTATAAAAAAATANAADAAAVLPQRLARPAAATRGGGRSGVLRRRARAHRIELVEEALAL